MSSPLISIIVPVYNVEPYLCACLDSILAQTFTNWETILINDGSTDKSGVICDEYASNDSRIRVIHKENGGVCAARNAGIEETQGEYLYFCDADDEMMRDCLATLYTNMKEGVDLVTASYQRYQDGVFIPEERSYADGSLSIKDYIEAISTIPNARFYERYLFTKLFRKSIVEAHHLRFDTHLAYREDVVFLYSYVVACRQTTICVDYPVYKYYRRSSGAAATHTKKLTPHSSDIFFAIERCHKLVEDADISLYALNRLKSEMVGAYNQYCKLLDKNSSKLYGPIVNKMDKSLYRHLMLNRYIKMKVKNFLRPAYHYLKNKLR